MQAMTELFMDIVRVSVSEWRNKMFERLEDLVRRLEELNIELTDPDTINNQEKYRQLMKEQNELTPIVEKYLEYKKAKEGVEDSLALLEEENDEEMRELAKEELNECKQTVEQCEQELKILMLPKDPNDDKNIYLEIRAGTGGDESALFAGDLFRMYSRYAERQKWQVEFVSASPSDLGGYKEIVVKIVGQGAYSKLKFESGGHRVQRVPETESQGRVHTSACTVAVLPEADEIGDVVIDPSELRIDVYRASGAGGQHIQKTESAVRITHLPTGIVVECQDERSQHKNKERAMGVLISRIHAAQVAEVQAKESSMRKSLIGSGDRSERIRTYNYPQGRVTDHRINLTLYKLDSIMDGDLDCLISPLTTEHQAEQLAALAEGE